VNSKIQQLIRNLHVHLTSRLNEDKRLNKETLFYDPLANAIIDSYFETSLSLEEKSAYSKEALISELKDLFKKADTPKSVAESPELEAWLDSAKRINPEIRFECYKHLLIQENKGDIVEQLDADTYKILDSCRNPRDSGSWDRRGLVYGHVQSGKTANYVGLINRAFDAGYQIVIVLTGITEDLRSQTQKRIDSGVVGKNDGITIGVGKHPDFQSLERIIPATSTSLDLRRVDDWRYNTLDITKKSIWVIKKNKTVLENLIWWLDKQRINQESVKIMGCPFLVIDDEADNASIQSLSKKEFELWETGQDLAGIDFENLTDLEEEKLNKAKEAVIKAINRSIRVALSLMDKKSFIAYTATPYSVISGKTADIERSVIIRGKTFDIDANNDLFPEHFIIPIKPGKNYLGIERIFTTEAQKKLPIVFDLTDTTTPFHDDINTIFPAKRSENYSFLEIPKSLEQAIIHFITSIIIRNFRGQNDYNTLLIHTSHLTKNADYLADKVDKYIVNLRNILIINGENHIKLFNDALLEIKKISKSPLFNEYFGIDAFNYPKIINKNDILEILNSNITPLDIVSYHSSNDQSLLHPNHTLKYDLKDSEGGNKYRNYIVIGGNRLSRGLTLEGLTTSYFIRSSTRQDSLYQMGRWFGYRKGYEDLIRIFMTKDQILWFEGVYKLEMDLRKDFEENNSDDIKIMPRDAIIKLAYHTSEETSKKFPSICDPNKLRNTKRELMSFSGPTKTNKIIYNKELQLRNFHRVIDFMKIISQDANSTLYDNNKIPKIVKNTNINYENIGYAKILKLIYEYESHKNIQVDLDSLAKYIEENKSELNSWSVVLIQKLGDPVEIQGLDFEMEFYNKYNVLESQIIKGVRRKWEEDLDNSDTRCISQFLDRGSKDNSFDIIDDSNKHEFENNHSQASKKYRNLKKKPILIIYPVVYGGMIFPLFYFILPIINGGKKVEYIVRQNRNN
jgi:hypothetical protein